MSLYVVLCTKYTNKICLNQTIKCGSPLLDKLCGHSAVVDPLFIVTLIVCGCFALGPCHVKLFSLFCSTLWPSCDHLAGVEKDGPLSYKPFFMLKTAEHEYYPAHKC